MRLSFEIPSCLPSSARDMMRRFLDSEAEPKSGCYTGGVSTLTLEKRQQTPMPLNTVRLTSIDNSGVRCWENWGHPSQR